MRLVELMTQMPPKCLYCGCGNVADETGQIGPFLDLERDVNWGDPTYLCARCVALVAATCGYVDQSQADEMQGIIEEKTREIHDLEADLSQHKARVKQIIEGRKALRAEQAALDEKPNRRTRVRA